MMILALVEDNQVKTKKVYIVSGETIQVGGEPTAMSTVAMSSKLGLGAVVGILTKRLDTREEYTLLVKTNKSLELKPAELQEVDIPLSTSTPTITLIDENLANIITTTPSLTTTNTTYTISDITVQVS